MTINIKVSEGHYCKLGTTIYGEQINFAIYSSTATKVELCLFDLQGNEEIERITMRPSEQAIWHIGIEGISEGQIYSYFVDGEFNPEQGIWHDANQALLDPYAKQIHGEFSWDICENNQFNQFMCLLQPTPPKAKVCIIQKYAGERPVIPWHKTVIYECHVKGVTQHFPNIPSSIAGKFSALSCPEFIKHIKGLGVTSLELLPVQYFISEEFLVEKGLSNYWGYNTLGFFAPHPAYLVDNDVTEFQAMVEKLHAEGIEVIIDVVFNHTAEGSNLGPTLSFRGIDNSHYYRIHPKNKIEYINDTGCGNTINICSPTTLRLVMDSLRYWVEYMGVDGFRFDLAPILGREQRGFNPQHAFFQALNQDPILSGAKLIAEPWDIGPVGYQLANFTLPWREWNDQYRDVIRRFWRGDHYHLPVLARHFHGSGYLFESNKRPVTSGINFITAHDGFTLADLVSYSEKNNFANEENNCDGHNENSSSNWGSEGETDDPAINSLRLRMQKNMLLTLLLSQGVPMIAAGTEVAHSQQGNNNAYCQDNDMSWIQWQKDHAVPSLHPLYQFIKQVLQIRQELPFYDHSHFIHDGDPRFSVRWLNSEGVAMNESDWQRADNHCLGYWLTDILEMKSLLVLFNAGKETLLFSLPTTPFSKLWQQRVDTSALEQVSVVFPSACNISLKAHSSWILLSVKQEFCDE